jgi:acyl carrier protein phosphodiesterase
MSVLNYISHIQLAYHTQTSLVGAFLGDFVKGSDLNEYTGAERLGILLHRKVDSFTDQHAELSVAKTLFPKHLRRYSGIYFDHLLMSNWSRFSSFDISNLFNNFYQELEHANYESNGRYTRVKRTLIRQQWLSNYQEEVACLDAMRSIESRFKHSAVFAEDAYTIMTKNRTLLEDCFSSFYPSLMRASEDMSDHLKERLLTTEL